MEYCIELVRVHFLLCSKIKNCRELYFQIGPIQPRIHQLEKV